MASKNDSFDCAVIGNWHLAYVTAACLTKLGHRVVLVNTEESGADELPPAPVYEPGLPEILASSVQSGKLEYREGFDENWSALRVWLAIDTPVNAQDEVDVEPLRKVIQEVSDRKKSQTRTLIISSQIPLEFCSQMEKETGLQIAYVPENLRLGHGINTFLNADRTVIGASSVELGEEVKAFLKGVETDFLICDLATAEMVKHATNAFLATSISFSNELARIGEKYNVDNQLVGKALRMDKRIGKQAYVVPGLGFAGGTLPRDLRVLQKLGANSETPTPLVDAVLKVNESTTDAVFDAVSSYFGGALEGKKVLVLGYTYKPETNTLRRSLSVTLAQAFRHEKATIWGFDPFMNASDLSAFESSLLHFNKWEEIPSCPDVILLMTARPAFSNLDWGLLRAKSGSRQPVIVDVRGILSQSTALKNNFAYKGLWQPVQRPEGESAR